MRIFISAVCLLGFLASVGCKGLDWPHPVTIVAISLLASGASLFGIAAASLGGWVQRCALLALGSALFGAQFLIYMLRDPGSRLVYVDWWETIPELFYRGSFPMLLVFAAVLVLEQWTTRFPNGRVHAFFANVARLRIGVRHLLLMTVVASLILTGVRLKTPYFNSLFPRLTRMNEYLIEAACEAAIALGVFWIGRDSQKTFLRFVSVTLFAVAVSLIEPYHYQMDWRQSISWVVIGILQCWTIFLGVVILHDRRCHKLPPGGDAYPR